MNEVPVSLKLTRAEAIVLIEFLMRYRDKDRLVVEHEAEEQLLYDLCSGVENQLPELFNPAWHMLVERSRAVVLADTSE
jgi:hypothetical protein